MDLHVSVIQRDMCTVIRNYGCVVQEMGMDGERKRIAMAGATGAIEEDYRQGLAAHAARHNKVGVGAHARKDSLCSRMHLLGKIMSVRAGLDDKRNKWRKK